MAKSKVQVMIRVPEDLMRALDEDCREKERTRPQTILFALKQYLEQSERERFPLIVWNAETGRQELADQDGDENPRAEFVRGPGVSRGTSYPQVPNESKPPPEVVVPIIEKAREDLET
jgi:predicted transcriptional regulator